MGAVKICIVLVCLVVIGGNWGFDSSVVATSLSFRHLSPRGGERIVKCKKEDYEKVIRIATKEIGVVEGTVENSGPRILAYLSYCGIRTPSAWCAAFVSFVFKEAGYGQPRTAWSPALFPKDRIVNPSLASPSLPRGAREGIRLGLIYGIYFASLGRIGHCGIIEKLQGDFIAGIEGNTNLAGSRNGDGVYRKIRHKRTIYRYADWF